MIAPIYRCPSHGETWHVECSETCDTENDEVYEIMICSRCGREVSPIVHDGVPVCHILTDEEMFLEMCTDEDDDDGGDMHMSSGGALNSPA